MLPAGLAVSLNCVAYTDPVYDGLQAPTAAVLGLNTSATAVVAVMWAYIVASSEPAPKPSGPPPLYSLVTWPGVLTMPQLVCASTTLRLIVMSNESRHRATELKLVLKPGCPPCTYVPAILHLPP